MPNIEKTDKNKARENKGKITALAFTESVNAKWQLLGHFDSSFYKVKQRFATLPSNHASRCSPKCFAILPPIKTCIQMLIATLFIISKTGKQSTCPLKVEWINRLCMVHPQFRGKKKKTANKRNNIDESRMWHCHCSSQRSKQPPLITKTQINLKCISLSERGQTQKVTYCTIVFV